MNMKLYWLIISIPLLFTAVSCHRGKIEENLDPSRGESIMTDEAGEITISRGQFDSMHMMVGDPVPKMFSNMVGAHGYIVAAPGGRAKISTMIPGRVSRINISVGDFIRSGQTLFTVEGPEVIKLQQDYAVAFHRLKLLEADYNRLKMLSDERIAAEKDFLKAEGEYKSVQAEVEGMKALLKMNYIDPSAVEEGNIVPFLSVKSPISGTIIKQELMLGQHVEPLETAMEVVNNNKLRLQLEVFETSLSDVAVGQQVRFATLEQPEKEYSAILSHIGKSISEESRTVECFATMGAEDRILFVNNMYIEASIITWERESLAIPEEAVIREHERDYVLILTEEKDNQMTFRQIPVQTGATRQGHTEILDEDLSDVLLEGVYSLKTAE